MREEPSGSERDAFLESHLDLVKRVFSRLRIGLPQAAAEQLQDDLISAGCIGLIQAFDRYDDRLGASFDTFASHRIRGAMLDELRRQDWLSKQSRRRLKEIQAAFSDIERSKSRPASDDEVAESLQITTDQLRKELVDIGPATLVFLEGLGSGQEGADWNDFIADTSSVAPDLSAERLQVQECLTGEIGKLPEMEKKVLFLLLDEDLGQMEIAEVLGVSPSRVSQIYSKAIARLQGALRPLFER